MVKKLGTFEKLAIQLKDISESLAHEEAALLTSSNAKKIRETLNQVYARLKTVMDDLDPIKHPGFMFDPSNPNIVGRIIGITMIAQDKKPLAIVDKFYGSGVYAIYYNGNFPAYSAISQKEHPIYVGKADPIDQTSKTPREQGDKLCGRLNEHRKNIIKANDTIMIEDFEYRALVVQTGWQASAEDYLIHLFQPIWNSEMDICYGFGKHGDDPKTRANLRSPWDTMHPGRDWAHRDTTMMDARPKKRIMDDIARHLAKKPPFESIDQLLRVFLEEMRSLS